MSATKGVTTTPTSGLKTQANYKASNAEVVACASHMWPQILISHGIGETFLSGKHSPCPIHGGKDGFRFTNEGKGSWVCATCTEGKFNDGFNLIALHNGISNTEAFKRVAQYLNLDSTSSLKKNNEKQLSNPIKQSTNQQAKKIEQDQKLLIKKKVASTHADNILSGCVMRPHPYLIQKGINQSVLVSSKNHKVTDKQTVYANALIIPIYDIDNHKQIIGAQFINADGSRAYITSTLIAEGIHIIQGNDSSPFVCIVEGYATALTVSMATGAKVIVAFDANGIQSKAARLKASFFGKQLVFFADNDINNVGQKAAHTAATKTHGLIITPPDIGQDWNDYYQANGLDATKTEIDKQLEEQRVIKELEMSVVDDKVINDLPGGLIARKKPTNKDVLPKNFKFISNELIFEKRDKDGEIVQEISVASKINVTAKQCDLYSGGNTGLTLEFINLFGKSQKWAMPRSMLSDEKSTVTTLCSLGARVLDKKRFNEYLMQSNPAKELYCVDQIGWHSLDNNRLFVLPNKTIGHSQDKDKVVYQSETLDSPFEVKGTIAEWKENIGKNCSGNSRLIFGISHGLASTLLNLTHNTNGGVNFFGQSSTGKTTIAQVCASLFGKPTYLSTCRTTTNAAEKLAHSRNDCLLILDELAQMNTHEIGDAIYTLGNGAGKERMTANGDLRKVLRFRCNYLLTGEIPVSQHINESGRQETEGQLVRILDIPAVIGEHGVFDCLHGFESGASFSNYLKEQCIEYYGTCAIAFIEELTKPENIIKIPEKLKQIKAELIENLPQGIQGQTERAINRFALAACAGELATEWNLTGWQSGEAITSTRKCLDAWLAERGGVENKEGAKLLKQVRAFFGTHGNSRFIDINKPDTIIYNCAGYKESKNDEWFYYVEAHAFEEIHKGFTKNFAIQTLINAKWIEPLINDTGKIQASRQKKIPKVGNIRVYFFNQITQE